MGPAADLRISFQMLESQSFRLNLKSGQLNTAHQVSIFLLPSAYEI